MQQQLEMFKNSLPKKPYCKNYKDSPNLIRQRDHALRMRLIQPNYPNCMMYLVYDIDKQCSVSDIVNDLLLPYPHFFVQNPENQHAHVYYTLEVPVHMNADSSPQAMRYLAAVDCALWSGLGADNGYCRTVAKNPVHPHWTTYVGLHEPYDLFELSEYVDLTAFNDRRYALPEVATGRNVNLFNRLRRWSYKAIRQGWPDSDQWHLAVLNRAEMYNAGGYENLDIKDRAPLPFSEVKATAKSVARWTYKHFSPEGFSRLQAARGARKGKKRRDELMPTVLEMRAQGATHQAISDAVGVPKQTITDWLKRHLTESHIR